MKVDLTALPDDDGEGEGLEKDDGAPTWKFDTLSRVQPASKVAEHK